MVLDPAALKLGSERPWLYVADSEQGKIEIVDLNTDTVLDRYIPAGHTPRAVAITPDGKKLFVSNEQPIPTGSIVVIEIGDVPGSAHIIDDIRAVACPQGLAMSRDGTKLYVASQCGGGDDPVFVLDTRSDRVVSTIRGLAVGVSVALDPDDETLYVARGNAPCVKPGGRPGSPFSAVDLREQRVGPTICLDTSVNYIAVSHDGDFVFVANGMALSVFDGKKLRAAKWLKEPEQREAAGRAALIHTIRLEGAVAGIGVAEDNSTYAWIPSTPRLFLYSPGKSN
jgi:6-phosphogluconolactonase (cycloisomerase 2 family)